MRLAQATLALALATSLTGSAGASAFNRSTSETGAALAWAKPLELTVTTEGLSADERAAVAKAAATWSKTGCVQLTVMQAGATTATPASIVVKRGAIDDKTQAAHTDVHVQNPRAGVVDGAVITLDASRSFTVAGAGGALDLETIVLHELGHALGLGHPISLVRDRTSVMNAGAKPGQAHRALGADDVAGVCSIYAGPKRG